MSEDNTQRLHDIAEMYYLQDMTQAAIANKYGLSRPTVSRMLSDARDRGIVKIIIANPSLDMGSVEKKFMERFSLNAVKVIPIPSNDHDLALKVTGREAAHLFAGFLEKDDRIGIDWGHTINEIGRNMPSLSLTNSMIMQLCGNLDNADAFTYATEIIGNISFRLTAKSAFTLPYPVIVDNSIIFEILMHDEKVRANMDLIESCNKLIVNLGVPNETNCLYKSGYLKPADLAMLQTRGAVGSICCHYFNNNGEICDQQLDKRTVSISYESIKKAELVILHMRAFQGKSSPSRPQGEPYRCASGRLYNRRVGTETG